MARPQMYYRWDIPASVGAVVSAICADYERRERIIKHAAITGAVLDKCVELNAIVDKALDTVDPGARKEMLRDIADRRSYYRSCLKVFISRNAYYRKRREVVHCIAEKMALL